MKDPDSVKVDWKLPSAYYFDVAVDTFVNYDSVLVYYKTDGTYPERQGNAITGTRLAGFKVTSSIYVQTNVSVGGVNCSQAFRFGAFVTNNLPTGIKYSNRISDSAAGAKAGPVTSPCSPANNLMIESHASGNGYELIVNWMWMGSAATSPENILLMYRMPDADSLGGLVLTPPTSYGDGRFNKKTYYDVNGPGNNIVSGILYLTENLTWRTPYLLAAYNSDADTVWSKDIMPVTGGGPWDTALTTCHCSDNPPAGNPIVLTATRVNSRTIGLKWSGSLATQYSATGGRLKLMYGYKTSAAGAYKWVAPAALDSSHVLTVDSFTLEAGMDVNNIITSNRTHYLIVAPADTMANVNDSAQYVLCRDTLDLYVDRPPAESLSLSLLADTAFRVDYSKLVNMDPNDLLQRDKYLQYGIVIVSDTGQVDTGMFDLSHTTQTTINEIINGAYNRSGRGPMDTTFIAKIVDLTTGGTYVDLGLDSGHLLNLNKRHYVSMAFLTDSKDPSKPVYAGSVQYKYDKPWFDTYSMTQINDSFIRVQFKVKDTSDGILEVKASYAVNDTGVSMPVEFEGYNQFRTGYYALSNDGQVKTDSLYTAYMKIKGARYKIAGRAVECFKANDTTRISVKLTAWDKMGSTDTLSIRRTVRVDGKAPGPVDTTYTYNAVTRMLAYKVICPAAEVTTIRFDFDSTLDSSRTVSGDTTTLTLTVPPMQHKLFVRLLDVLGNYTALEWNYIINYPVSLIQPGLHSADNGNVGITVTGLTLSDSVQRHILLGLDTARMYLGGFAFPPATRVGLLNNGFSYAASSGYSFYTVYPLIASFPVWNEGITVSLAVDTTLLSAATLANTFIYRWHKEDGTVSFVGGRYDNEGHIVADTVKLDVVANAASITTADSGFFFLACDTQRVRVDASFSRLTYDSTTQQLRFHLTATDNIQGLTARVKIFAYDTSHQAVSLMDSSLKAASFDRDILVPLAAFSEAAITAILKNGTFAAVWVTDQYPQNKSRRTFYYTRCLALFDSIEVSFNPLQNKYQIISLPYDLQADEQDVLYVMRDVTQGVYDRARYRLYRVDTSAVKPVKEFVNSGIPGKNGVDTDPSFKFRPGNAYFMTTRYAADNIINVHPRQALTPAVNTVSRGYLLASAQTDGWVLAASPHLGNARVSAMASVSTLQNIDSVHPPLGERLFVNPWAWSLVGSDVLAATEYGQGFAAYLYAGETLLMPVTMEGDMLNTTGNPKATAVNKQGWRVNIALKDDWGSVIDAYNEIGVDRTMSATLPDLPLLAREGLEFGIQDPARKLCRKTFRLDGNGKDWSLELVNRSPVNTGAYQMTFDGLADNLPEGWRVVLVDSANARQENLMNGKRAYLFSVNDTGSRCFKIYAGTGRFIQEKLNALEGPVTMTAYPNPFNPSVNFTFPNPGKTADIRIYSITGEVIHIFNNVRENRMTWNGAGVPSGMYIVKCTVGNKTFSQTIVLIR
ncbi:MAG: T9SS type A sorting domain-containing protein [Fibrobacterota bacterium]